MKDFINPAIIANWIERAYFEGFGDACKEQISYEVSVEQWKKSFAYDNFNLSLDMNEDKN